jgi:hypothetical protein
MPCTPNYVRSLSICKTPFFFEPYKTYKAYKFNYSGFLVCLICLVWLIICKILSFVTYSFEKKFLLQTLMINTLQQSWSRVFMDFNRIQRYYNSNRSDETE